MSDYDRAGFYAGRTTDETTCHPDVEIVRLRRELAEARAEITKLLGLLVDEGAESPPRWYALLDDGFSPLGKSWHECDTKEDAEKMVLTAGLEAVDAKP